MRKLTDNDMLNIAGSTVKGHYVEGVRIKRGEFTDSDHYGIVLCRNDKGHYVTWQFHLDEHEKPTVYWGHYFMEDRDAALRDFDTRDLSGEPEDSKATPVTGSTRLFKVTITEKLQRAVTVEAESRDEAEQIVSDRWRNGEYVLGSDDFTGIAEFNAWEYNTEENQSQ